MKEQVISPRGVRRASAQAKGYAQRPARRDGSVTREINFSPRALFAYVPKALKVALGILILVTLFVGYRVAASAKLFQVRAIDITGTSRTSAEEMEGLARRAVARTGVWRADLTALSNELGRLPGVRSAVVSRVLPDGLRIRVTERVPIAVVRTTAGHFVWVDDDGVALGEMKLDDQMPPFFIRGWNEDGTDEARQENIARVQKYQEAVREWTAVGLAARISEVTLIDVRDVRAQLAAPDSQIEVRLGSQDLGQGLQRALAELDRYKQGPGASSIISVAVQKDRVVIGQASGASNAPLPATTESTPDDSTRNNAATDKNKNDKPAANSRRANDRKNEESKPPKPRVR